MIDKTTSTLNFIRERIEKRSKWKEWNKGFKLRLAIMKKDDDGTKKQWLIFIYIRFTISSFLFLYTSTESSIEFSTEEDTYRQRENSIEF